MPVAGESSSITTVARCIFLGSGIIGTLLIYGLMQERIMTLPYSGEMFTVSAYLVFCNRVVNVLYASTMIGINNENFQAKAPMWKYLVISISNVLATTCQYEALKYVSFPVQMLGKSFKMMPVMLWGIAISGKRYGLIDWGVAACVTFGVTEFLMTGPTASTTDQGDSFYGFVLLAAFLAFDGLTSTMQEKLFSEYNLSKYNQMFYVNMCSSVVSFGSLLATGQFLACISFTLLHADFAAHAALLSSSAAASQFFIYSQVKEFGALVFAATMNVRQVVSIIVSYLRYDNSITLPQVFGLIIVFGALFSKSYVSLSNKNLAEKDPLIQRDKPASEAKSTV